MDKIFGYQRDGTTVHADPVALHRAFARALGGDVEATLKAAGPPEEGVVETPTDVLRRLDAEEKLAGAARLTFALPAFDPATGQGATDDDALAVLWAWLDWLAKKKPTAEPTPTSPPPTVPGS